MPKIKNFFVKLFGARGSDNDSESAVARREKRRNKIMPEKNEDVKAEKTEEVKEEKTEEVKEEPVKTEEKTEEPVKTEEKTEEPPAEMEVQETEPQGNGIDINDLVTKDMLSQAMAAMEAKYDAVVKENADLKNKLAETQQDADSLRDKYENKDFGNSVRQGVIGKDKSANETFESYSKQFM